MYLEKIVPLYKIMIHVVLRIKAKCSTFNCYNYSNWLNKYNSDNIECYGEECDIFDLNVCCYQQLTCDTMGCDEIGDLRYVQNTETSSQGIVSLIRIQINAL